MNRSKTQTQMLIYDRIISQLNTRNIPQSKTTINTSPLKHCTNNSSGNMKRAANTNKWMQDQGPIFLPKPRGCTHAQNPVHIHWRLGVPQQKVSSFGGEHSIIKSHI